MTANLSAIKNLSEIIREVLLFTDDNFIFYKPLRVLLHIRHRIDFR